MSIPRQTDLRIFRRLLQQARPYSLEITGVVLLSLLTSPLWLLTPLPLKIAVDSVIGSKPLPGFLQAIVPESVARSTGALLLFAVGLLLLVALLSNLQDLASSSLSVYTSEKLLLDFRARLFQHLQRLSLSYIDAKGTADSIYRVQYDAIAIQSIAIDNAIPFLSSAFILVSMIYVTVRIDWKLALVALTICPPLYLLSQRYRKRLRSESHGAKRLESSALSVVQETLGALRVVKAFGQEDREHEKFVSRSREGMRARIRLVFIGGRYSLLLSLLTALGTGLVLLIGVNHVRVGILTLGNLLLVMGYVSMVYSPLKTMSNRAVKLQSALASAERAFAILDQATDVPEKPDARHIARTAGSIAFRNVSFAYVEGSPVLHDVSFDIPAGARLGIAGATGAGKTTLTNLLMRFYDPSSGQILLDGVDLCEYKLADLRNQFALVLQEPVLFSASVAENIAYARPGAPEEEIIEAAKLANAHDFITRLPQGYQTSVGNRGITLSGGERQRISLARAFLKDAPILLLDEPTSSVDVKTEAAIMEAMNRLMHGRTTIMIAHRLSTLDSCNVRLEMEQGRVITELHRPPEAMRKPSSRPISDETKSLQRHPAVRAWAKLSPEHMLAERIEILKFRQKTPVYRLTVVGRQALSIIAKRCTTENAAAERRVYEEVQPLLPVSGLEYFGVVEEPNSRFSWLFVEDVAGEPYRHDLEKHRILAGEWLGRMHYAGMKTVASLGLPDRGLNYYLNSLQVARDRLCRNLDNPAFEDSDRRVLKAIAAQCDFLEKKWGQIEDWCGGIPSTFVHGDFHANNVQVRTTKDGMTLVPFDWEHAGWGISVTDLTLQGMDLSAYLSVMGGQMPNLNVRVIPQLVKLWQLSKVVDSIYIESCNLENEWFERSLKHMRYYEAEISEGLQAVGLQK